MRRISLRGRAREDVAAIWSYGADRWGEKRADRYVAELDARMQAIARGDAPCRPADNLHSGLMVCRSGRHRIYFILTDAGVDVIRILHARMDPGRHLPDEDG